jgi:molybdopterin-guanine dinucleotide biosynthesis protein A
MGQDKAQLPWGGSTLLAATVEKLFLICQEVIVVGPRRPLAREVRWTQDRYTGKGPLAGLHAGLEEAAFDSAILLPCDMPTVSVRLLEEMVRLSKGVDIVIPIHFKGCEPLCTWYSRGVCLPVVRRLLEEGYTSLLDPLSRVRVKHLEIETVFPGVSVESLFANLNSPIDYERAKQDVDEGAHNIL